MIENIPLQNLLVVDIETVPATSDFSELDDHWKYLWGKKSKSLSRNDESPEDLYDRAGIYAEFGKVICISAGVFVPAAMSGSSEDHYGMRVKSFYSHDEKALLSDFCDMMSMHFSSPTKILCGHNAKEFDFPYLSRRILINNLKLPALLNTPGKKPWEVNHLDTMELWKFGDYKSFTSLELLAALFGIPTPKDDIDGSMVKSVYYEENDLERIRVYCEKDVITLANLLLRLKGLPVMESEHIEIVQS
ncbi:MAG: 3'-5' exonuclease [Bacteroidetes bacterium]|nr:3'-5' exonuclease [Bacteroidota bacterium]